MEQYRIAHILIEVYHRVQTTVMSAAVLTYR